jgi:hypothetical protein
MNAVRHHAPRVFRLLACFVLLAACVPDHFVWQGFEGTPMCGAGSYAAELRVGDMRDGTALRTDRLFVVRGKLRYEMQGAGPLGQMILLARLEEGRAWLVNPANNGCLEGSFAPQRWMDIGHLLGAFPKVAHARIISNEEELLGKEMFSGYRVVKIRRTGRHMLFGEERDFTEFFWLAEEFCIPLLHEDGMVRTELAQIHKKDIDDSLFTLPAECRKVSSFVDLLK